MFIRSRRKIVDEVARVIDSSTAKETEVAPGNSESPSRRWMTPARWLVLAVGVYFAVSFVMSWLRAIELQTTTWDLGLYQQALWTTAHGRAFYETADVETGGYGSLLEIHSVFLLYLVVPLYSAFPYETTLFAVQSAVVALAAVPLFYLARDASHSSRLGWVAGAVYLCWTPTLSSNLYDFHAEAFLPIEMFALLLFWRRERYIAGFAVAITTFLTFEFAPVIVFAVGIFALLPGALAPSAWSFFRRRFAEDWFGALREWMRVGRVRASVVLAGASVAAYFVLLAVRVDVLPGIVGTYPLPSAASGYVIGATPAALGLTPGNLTVGFGAKATYWLLVMGLLAFVPFLSPRALVLTAPWFVFTLTSSNLNYVTLGFQYGFVVGSTLMVAFALALPRLRSAVEAWAPARGTLVDPSSSRAGVHRRRATSRRAVWTAMGVLLGINLALTPLNPWMDNSGLGSGYRVSYTDWTDSNNVRQLAQLIPADASIVTTDDLFPLVANDPNAYSLLWTVAPALALPFSFDHPPTYVFIAEDRTGAVPSWLAEALYDPSVYGVRGVAWDSPAGTVLLFEAGFHGTPSEYGQLPGSGGTFFGSSLASNSDGVATIATGSTFSSVVESVPGELGTVWYGPSLTLAPGNYSITVSLRAVSLEGFPVPNASTPVLWVGALAFAQPTFFGWSYDFPQLNDTTFAEVAFDVDLKSPTIEFDLQGVLLESSVQLILNYVEVAPG